MLASRSFHGVPHPPPPHFTRSNRYTLSPSSSSSSPRSKTTPLLPSSLSIGPLKRRRSSQFCVHAQSESSESTSNAAAQYTQPFSVKIPVGDRHVRLKPQCNIDRVVALEILSLPGLDLGYVVNFIEAFTFVSFLEQSIGSMGKCSPSPPKRPPPHLRQLPHHSSAGCGGVSTSSSTRSSSQSFPAIQKEKKEDLEVSSSTSHALFLKPLCLSAYTTAIVLLTILVETGDMGRQASAAVRVTDGETIVYTTVCLDDVPSEPSDFFPLSVHYQERFSAAGRTSGGFFKREGRARDHEVLICRLIDRPLRPTMLKGFYHETQILSWVYSSCITREVSHCFFIQTLCHLLLAFYLMYIEVLSYDGLHPPDSLAVTAAGIAVALSELPNSKTIAGVRIGLVNDKFIVNPTTKEMEDSELDLLLAGTDSAILMIEGYCNFLPEEKLLQAVEIGQMCYLLSFNNHQDVVRGICTEVESLVKRCGKPKMLDAIKLPPPELYRHVEEIAGDELVKVLQIKKKIPRRKALSSLEEKVLSILTEIGYVSKDEAFGASERIPDLLDDEDEDEEVVVDGEVDEGDVHIKPVTRKPTPLLFSEVDVKLVFKDVTSKFLRKRIVEESSPANAMIRFKPIGLKFIMMECCAYGFHISEWEGKEVMGETLLRYARLTHNVDYFLEHMAVLSSHALAVVTLGDKYMAQRIDNLEGADEYKRFYLQYSFPPSSVGEVGRMGAPSRREIGHGRLAERSLERILPSDDNFPYTIRVESTITESNGSSSMASVCGGCLALQDAGVPLRCSIAGIAMGMVLDTEEFGGDGTPLILSDITGSEDASGDMDFKVAGNEDGITAFQMDIKHIVEWQVGGITLPIMKQALLQAKNGRKHILG
ncbi:hypothetical protein C3L33_02352, partial [Rhododendron williamsianum]